MEEWRDIEGYEGLYQVSNEGRVKSLNFHRQKIERIIKPSTNKKGYKRVLLQNNGKKKNYLVHRLVAKTFISNPNDYPIINHKDENPSNNFVDNLEWCNSQYNNTYNNRHLKCAHKIAKSHLGSKASDEARKHVSEAMKKRFSNGAVIWNKGLPSKRRKQVIQYNQNMEEIKTFESVRKAALETNSDLQSIIDCCKKRRKTYKGFIWEYGKEISVY